MEFLYCRLNSSLEIYIRMFWVSFTSRQLVKERVYQHSCLNERELYSVQHHKAEALMWVITFRLRPHVRALLLLALLHFPWGGLLSSSTLSHSLGFPGWLSFLLRVVLLVLGCFWSVWRMPDPSAEHRRAVQFSLVDSVQGSSIVMRLPLLRNTGKTGQDLKGDLENKTRKLCFI